MSDPDQGDEDKGFLARWSQRKQEAKQPEPKPDTPVVEADVPPAPVAEANAAPEFDLSSLPKLEDLTGATDITGFLRKGVPEHLRNAALRKSWALDPAIRNYVNPALDYAYDWNTPGGVPGSSEIGAGMDVARMVAQIMGSGEPAADPSPAAATPESRPDDAAPVLDNHPEQEPAQALPPEALRLSDEGVSVGQNANPEAPPLEASPAAPQHPVRRHGTAKPIV
jgi:Protein of unknown function (DUF3306)